MNGFGIYVDEDGVIYEGQFLADKKHGYGKYQWTDGKTTLNREY